MPILKHVWLEVLSTLLKMANPRNGQHPWHAKIYFPLQVLLNNDIKGKLVLFTLACYVPSPSPRSPIDLLCASTKKNFKTSFSFKSKQDRIRLAPI